MLQKIEARTFPCFLIEETAEAKKGEATVFHVRRMSSQEAIEWELNRSRAIDDAKGLDDSSQARTLNENAADWFARVVEAIENNGETIEDPVKIKRFSIDYMTYDQRSEIVKRASNGFLLKDHEEELAKNGWRSSRGSSHGCATTSKDATTSTAKPADATAVTRTASAS